MGKIMLNQNCVKKLNLRETKIDIYDHRKPISVNNKCIKEERNYT